MHFVTLSAPRGRSIRLPSKLCRPSCAESSSCAEIQGCGACCSSPSICFHIVVCSSSHQPTLWTVCLPCLFRGSYSLCFGSALIANILSLRSWHGPDISVVSVDIFSQNVAKALLCFKTFYYCEATALFLLSVALSSSSCFVRKAFNKSPSLSLSLHSLFSSVAAGFKQLGSDRLHFLRFLCRSLTTYFSFLSSLRQALCNPRRLLSIFLSALRVPMHLRTFTLRCSPRVAATWFSLSHTTLYFSIFHFNPSWLFFFFFQNRCCFLTAGSFHLSSDHEDDRDTLYMVLRSRGAASDVSDHSLLHFSISSSS